MSRRIVINKKILIGAVVIIVIAAAAFVGGMELTKKKSNSVGANKAGSTAPQIYTSFTGDYSFLVPDGYVIDDHSIPGTQLIIKNTDKLTAKTVDEIYSKGVLTVQPFSTVMTDTDAFKGYVSGTLKDMIAKSLNGTSDVTFSQTGSITTALIKTTVSGKLARIQYIFNSTKPVILASGDDNAAFQSVVNSLGVASSKNKDYTTVQSSIFTINSLIKNRMDSDTYRLSSDSFKAKTSLDALKKLFDQSTSALTSNVSITGGVFADTDFSATLLYTKLATKTGDQAKTAVGAIDLQKNGDQWELVGLTVPTNDAFVASGN
ncbi:MAG: hypothetical protein NTW50_02700 [Candidatus Berkelbacteria bacterium]|nr:hypothetical protein [Candidatus Berkelbacteria bacterium]